MKNKFLDLVIGGPDMSGTSTQIKDTIKYFEDKNKLIRDIRGTESDALFHADIFRATNGVYSSINDVPDYLRKELLQNIYELMSGGGTNQDLQVASMIENNSTTYINPNSADVWIMEEPTKRGAGQVNRVIEQRRSSFGDFLNPLSAALCHQAYRTDEFLRFRGPLRDSGKVIVRSRSEESACYQIKDDKVIPNGISMGDYLNLPGHKVAFGNAPTNIFIVCGPEDWKVEDYLELKRQRSDGRSIDDHEANAEYQVLVNNRYASSWLNDLYSNGCSIHGGIAPEITRFDIYAPKDEIRKQMYSKLDEILLSPQKHL